MTDYAGDADVIMVALLAWLKVHQLDLLANEERRKHGIALKVDFNNHETVDISIKLDLTERVTVKRGDAGQLDIRHLAEVQDTPAYADEFWKLFSDDTLLADGKRPRPRREQRSARAGNVGRRAAGKAQPAQRRAINHQVAIDLRRNQVQRIKAQQGPDGSAYPPRKKPKELKGKKGRIKRQKAAMFVKIRTAKHMKVKATSDQIEVGFFGWVARVAHIHQSGQQDRVTKKGPVHRYLERPLLGSSETDRALIRESLLRHSEKTTS